MLLFKNNLQQFLECAFLFMTACTQCKNLPIWLFQASKTARKNAFSLKQLLMSQPEQVPQQLHLWFYWTNVWYVVHYSYSGNHIFFLSICFFFFLYIWKGGGEDFLKGAQSNLFCSSFRKYMRHDQVKHVRATSCGPAHMEHNNVMARVISAD